MSESSKSSSNMTRRQALGVVGGLVVGGVVGAAGGYYAGLASAPPAPSGPAAVTTTVTETATATLTAAPTPKYTFYWLSHGSEADPVWMYDLLAVQWGAKALNVKANTAFFNNVPAPHKEAFTAAIAAGADGIASSCPAEGMLTTEIAAAKDKGIPVVLFNTDDPTSRRDAYVGGDNVAIGASWANYLVSNGLVKKGDFVLMPVEVPSGSYAVNERKGLEPILDAAGVKHDILDCGYPDPAESISRYTTYLTAHGATVNAIIGLGDMVMGETETVFQKVGWGPGKVPVVGWGNSIGTATAVKDGYVNAATWQYPDSQGFMPLVLLYMAKEKHAIGYDIFCYKLYDKSNVDTYAAILKAIGG
jgi:simple sugar transport system substrate-binding protein